MEFPDIYNKDFKKDNFKLAKEAIDFAISTYENQSQERKKYQEMYDSYNGIINPKEHESLTKPYGKKLKTKYIHHNFGLNKIKTLLGEFLSSPMEPTVETVDSDQVNKKFEKYLDRKAMLDMKPQIQAAREEGYDVFPGMMEQMENEQEFLAPNNFKTDNEIYLTKYLKGKIVQDKLKLVYKQNIIDGICTSMLCGKVDTVNGKDTVRRISPSMAMLMDYETEGFYDDSPYLGEKRYLFKHQIIREFNITKESELKELDEWSSSPALYLQDKSYLYKNGALMFPVYTIEFKTIANQIYFKIDRSKEIPYIREIKEQEYNEIMATSEKIKNYKIEGVKIFLEEVWEISRIGQTMYKRIQRVVKQANALENKKLRARYNYIFFGMDCVEGVKTPIQSVISKLDKSYNDIQFLINKELKKPSGNALGINMGFIDKNAGDFKDVMTELSDDGTIRYNTSAEGNKYGLDGNGNAALNGVNLGDKGRTLDILLRLKLDIENSIDSITGITRARVGAELATTTATTAQNNLETSRTVTYDFFYQSKIFIDEVMTRLVEKGKLNFIENNPELFGGIFSDEEFNFIKASSEIALENFTGYINDGRKEKEIMNKIEMLFAGDINSGQLRSKDVVRFYMADSLNEGLKVLDKAWEEINKISQQSQQSQEQNKINIEQQIAQKESQQIAASNQHDLDMIAAEGEQERETIRLEKSLEGGIKSASDEVKRDIADKKTNADIIKSQQKQFDTNQQIGKKPTKKPTKK